MKKIVLKDDNYCFVCGRKNKLGLKLKLELCEKETVLCEFITKKEHQGFSGIVHGGIIGLIMDEAMVNLLWQLGIQAVTSELSLRLRKPAYVGKKLIFKAGIEKKAKKILYTKALCHDSDGLLIATANAKCMKID